MDTAHSFPPPQTEPIDPTAASAASGGSFWTGAPKLLAASATLLGSIVALATVLVQAGVIGTQGPARTTATVPVQQVSERTAPPAAQTTPTVLEDAETPSLDGALNDLNGLLAGSARTRGDLGKLIADVQSGPSTIGRAEAVERIDEIVRQRERLHEQLAAFSAPAPLSKSLALLRDSITASLADDRLVRLWIVARYDGDVAADSLWQAQLEASRAASEAKRTFKAEYAGRLRSSGLSDFIPEY